MYADRVLAEGSKRSIKERLNGDFDDTFSHPNLGVKDLRLKLQGKSSQAGRVSHSGDLREKLSGMSHPPPVRATTNVQKTKLMSDAKVVKRSVPTAETAEENTANASAVKKTKQKSGSSVAALLKSLDLEKYLITFQAEEIDMTALNHMNDEDLKALGIPMGPRKKILLALDARFKS
ncbi:unnamed protein product [Victoria cruziana]